MSKRETFHIEKGYFAIPTTIWHIGIHTDQTNVSNHKENFDYFDEVELIFFKRKKKTKWTNNTNNINSIIFCVTKRKKPQTVFILIQRVFHIIKAQFWTFELHLWREVR